MTIWGFDYVAPAPLMSPSMTPAQIERFWSKIDKTPGLGPHGECWEWTAAYSKANGYPAGMNIDGHSYRASHLALLLAGKPRPDGDKHALHSCDNKRCVRADHLRWGTTEENHQDYMERRKYGPRILPPETVRSIRAYVGRHCDAARAHGVTTSCASQIRNGKARLDVA